MNFQFFKKHRSKLFFVPLATGFLVSFVALPAQAQDIAQEIQKVKAVTTLLRDVVAGITEVAILPLGIGAALQMYNRTLFRAI